jgi:Ran GTPase-activating protein (RanGAP) involved in mRNA processing and transport
MDNNITPLGCEFLARVLINPNNKITKLKLDNNPLTTKGIAELSVGLRQNSVIEKLSFNYCQIDSKGVKYIQEIMANINCKLRSLKLQGNPLGN